MTVPEAREILEKGLKTSIPTFLMSRRQIEELQRYREAVRVLLDATKE